MEKDREGVLSVAFKGSPERLARIKEALDKVLEETGGKPDPAGPISDWSQSGGWYLVLENEQLQAVRPDESLEKVAKNVYKAITKAEQVG